MGTLNTGYIGDNPSVNFVISWNLGSSEFTVTATKNADGGFSGGGWTVYIGFEGGSSGSAFLPAPVGSAFDILSESTTVHVDHPPSGTLYFYTTSDSFVSSGVIPYEYRKQASYSNYLTVTVEDRVEDFRGQLLGSGSYQVLFGDTVRATSLRTPPSYPGYKYASDTAATIYPEHTTLYIYYTKANYNIYYYENDILGTVINMPISPDNIKNGEQISSLIPERQFIVTLDANGGVSPYSSLVSSVEMLSWNTNESGTGTNYLPGDTYYGSDELLLYAKWPAIVPSVTLPTPTRQGYSFVGWAESASSTTVLPVNYVPQRNITIYAIWKSEDGIYIYDDSDKQYKGFIAWMYVNGSGWVRVTPYVYLNGSWHNTSIPE